MARSGRSPRAPLPPNTKMEKVLDYNNRSSDNLNSDRLNSNSRRSNGRRIATWSVRFLIIAVALLLLGSGAAERDAHRSDVLTFLGDRFVSPDTLPSDSFIVALDRRTTNPNAAKYSIILRGVDPVERALFQDARSGNWERFDLFRAAMIAEGIRDIERIRAYEARIDALVARVMASGHTTPQALTRALFEAMHRELLTRPYSLHCTELSKVMDTGHFNCVSATILFNCLAEKAGLDVIGLEIPGYDETPGHVLSRVRFRDGTYTNIETTAPTWFAMQSEQERQQATLERIAPMPAVPNPLTAQNAVPAIPEPAVDVMANHRKVNQVQLVAMIYYNRGVDLLAKKQHAEAAAAKVKALHLDQDSEKAWANLLVSINNWAVLDAAPRGKEGRRHYDVATFLLDQGMALDPTFEKFPPNYVFIFHDWMGDLTRLGRFEDARRVFAFAQERVPNNANLLKLLDYVNSEERRIMQQR